MSDSAKRLLSEEEVDRLAEEEVLAEARDVLSGLDIRLQQVRTGTLDAAQAAKLLLLDASNLRLKARSVTLAALGPLTHRLEDYLAGLPRLEDRHRSEERRVGNE